MRTRRATRWIIYSVLLAVFCVTLSPAGTPVRADGDRHTVVAGETLFRIALRYGVTVEALASANGISNTSIVLVGQVLIIPGKAAAPAPADPAAAPAAPAAPAGEPVYYTVAPGDTLNRISLRFGVSWQALMQANGITNPNLIRAGQRLLIPGKTHPAAPAPAENQAQAVAVFPGAAGAPLTTSLKTVGPAQLAVAGRPPDRTHVVKRGEGLGVIARQYGVSWEAIASYNEINNPDLIYAGMVLRIPPPSYKTITTEYDPNLAPVSPQPTGKSVLVILRQQRVYFYENGKLVRTSLSSTGLPRTPTVVGDFKIYVKYRAQTMYGPGYYLPSVPYVMYFFRDYGLHGTYWHNNFGRPMSHGCVNLPTPVAEWLYNWSEVGTPVFVRR
jgi:LysM repeat protein